MDQGKNQYTIMLTLIGHTGSAITLLNKLNGIEVSSSDQKLKRAAQALIATIRAIPELMHRTKLNLRNEAAGTAGTVGMTLEAYELKNLIAETADYCEQCVASVEPAWMIQARAAGWTPPVIPKPKATA